MQAHQIKQILKSISKKLLIGLGAMLVIGLALSVLLVGTNIGLKVSIAAINHTTDTHINADSLQGRWLGPLHASNIKVQKKDTSITAKALSLNWTIKALLKQHLQLDINGKGITAHNIKGRTIHADTLTATIDRNTTQQNLDATLTDHQSKLAIKASQSLAKAKAWRITIDSQRLNLKFIDPYFDTSIDSSIDVHVQANDTAIDIKEFKGSINQQPTTAQGKLQWRPKTHAATGQLQLAVGKNTLNARATTEHNITWTLKAPDLSQLHPDLSGQLDSTGNMTWQHDQWHGQMALRATSLHWQQNNLADTLNLDITPVKNYHRIQITHRLHQQYLTLSSTQKYHDHQYAGTVQQLQWSSDQAHHWQLEQPTDWQIGKALYTIKPFCMKSGKQRLCGNVSWHNEGDVLVHMTTDKFDLNQFRPWLPIGTTLPSQAMLYAKFTGQNGHIQKSEAKLDVSAGQWVLIDQYTKHNIPLEAIKLRLKQDKKSLQLNGNINISQQKPITMSFSLPHFQWPIEKTQDIQGSINWQTDQLASLPLPDIHIQKGSLTLKAKVDGTLNAPIINGHLTVNNATIAIPALGTTWDNLQLQATTKTHSASLKMSTQSASGTLQASSTLSWAKERLQGHTIITGKTFPIIHNSEYQIWISPNVTLNSKGWQQRIKGNIHIPKANITPKDFSNSIELSKDATFAHSERNTQLMNWPTGTLDLSIGEDAHINTHGISGQVKGQLNIHSEPGELISATGQINLLKGQYNAYGQALNINHGQLTYHHNQLDNPNLDIQASREVMLSSSVADSSGSSISQRSTSQTLTDIYNKTVVGIVLTGTLENPQHTLFSQPAGLAQSDILSYLVLGKTSSQGMGDSSSLLNAVSVLGLQSGGQSLSNQFKRHMGLADISLVSMPDAGGSDNGDASPTQNMAVALGKKLSDKLYVSYSVGIAEPSNTFKIRYQISKRWSVQSISNMVGNGLDLLFSF